MIRLTHLIVLTALTIVAVILATAMLSVSRSTASDLHALKIQYDELSDRIRWQDQRLSAYQGALEAHDTLLATMRIDLNAALKR